MMPLLRIVLAMLSTFLKSPIPFKFTFFSFLLLLLLLYKIYSLTFTRDTFYLYQPQFTFLNATIVLLYITTLLQHRSSQLYLYQPYSSIQPYSNLT